MGIYSEWQLSDGLKRARKDHELTQRELAKKLFGDEERVKNIQNWEQGRATPDFETLRDLQKIYGNCSLDYLFGTIDAKDHDTQFIMDETGLSEDAIDFLRHNNAMNKGARISGIGTAHLLRTEQEKFFMPRTFMSELLSFILTYREDKNDDLTALEKIVYRMCRQNADKLAFMLTPNATKEICREAYRSALIDYQSQYHENNLEELYKKNVAKIMTERRDEILDALPVEMPEELYEKCEIPKTQGMYNEVRACSAEANDATAFFTSRDFQRILVKYLEGLVNEEPHKEQKNK